MKELILATFPSEKATDVFNRLAGIVTSPEAKNSWNEAGNTANNMSSQLVKDMFSDNKTTRLTATTKLFREGSSGNPALVPIIIDYATGNPSNKSGVINSLVVLQNVDPELLRANREQIDSLFNTVKENGDQTTEHIQKLKSLMD
jgi:hypothetical protein